MNRTNGLALPSALGLGMLLARLAEMHSALDLGTRTSTDRA